MITIDKTHHGKKIVTKNGDVNQVQLAENQTTANQGQVELHRDFWLAGANGISNNDTIMQ